MGAIPEYVLRWLPKLSITTYEWRILIVIILNTIGKRKTSASISLDEFAKATGLLKPHICRTLSSLEQRRIISRATYKNISAYSFNADPSRWKYQNIEAVIKEPEIEEAFEKWFVGYPNQMRKEEAREAYHSLVKAGEATIEDLALALKGYCKWEKLRDQKFGRESDPLYLIFAHNFLRNKTYKDYIRFSELKTSKDVGMGFVRKGKTESPEAKERADKYAAEREKELEKLYGEGKSLEEIRLEMAEFSRKYWIGWRGEDEDE